jgi:elongation factor 2 kinase
VRHVAAALLRWLWLTRGTGRRVIAGEYIKHNSNSGYVECHRRATPQAFSHYTFEASRGRLIVVDIQGVNDLYTDPQMHTLEGTGYGEGNLGANGFALFFAAHRCSPLCAKLGLAPLPKSVMELARDEQTASAAVSSLSTASRSQSSAASSLVDGATAAVRTWRSADDSRGRPAGDDAHGVQAALHAARGAMSTTLGTRAARDSARRTWAAREAARWISLVQLDALPSWALEAHSWAADALPVAEEMRAAHARRVSVSALARARVSEHVAAAPDAWLMFAPVHLALARYYACGGLPVLDGVPDEPSAVFHACYAARGGDALAIRAMRDLMRGVVQDLVPGVRLASELPAVAAALTAALARDGDIGACVEQADAAATAAEKLDWLERAHAAADLRDADVDGGEPPSADELAAAGVAGYQLLEKLGHARLVAGNAAAAGEAFTVASEAAALRGKGKLSLKLAQLAEEALAQLEEDGGDATA